MYSSFDRIFFRSTKARCARIVTIFWWTHLTFIFPTFISGFLSDDSVWCFFYCLFKFWWPYCALLCKRARRRTLWQFLNELIFLFLVSQWSLVPPLRTLARISHRLCSLARGLMDMSKIAKIRTNGMGFNGLYILSLLSSKIVM